MTQAVVDPLYVAARRVLLDAMQALDKHRDAVILVATEGSSSYGPTAITLLAGVEPILSAAPARASAANILSPWNLGAQAGGDAATQ